MIVGLCGGIGSGKSFVSEIMKTKGIYIIDADVIARDLVRKGSHILQQIINVFGNRIVRENGELDRSALGKIVFSNSDELDKLDKIMHPEIYNKIENEIAKLTLAGENAILIDAAILKKIGLDKLCDSIWYISASREIRINRVINRNSLSREEAETRVDSQDENDFCFTNDINKVEINNEGTLEELTIKINNVFNKYFGEEIEKN